METLWSPYQQIRRDVAERVAKEWHVKFGHMHRNSGEQRREYALKMARQYKGLQPITGIWSIFAKNGWTPEETDKFLAMVPKATWPPSDPTP